MTALGLPDVGDDATRERNAARPTASTVLATLAAFAFVVLLIAVL
jgi:hypothetical protein